MSFEKGQYDVALGRVLRFLSQKDLWTCSLVNKTWNQLAKSELWRQPKFGTGSSTSIQSFRQFLKTLENAGGETKSLIKVMDVSQVQESLYETIDDNWLTMILQNCPHLRSLIIRDTSFLTTSAIRKMIINFKRNHNYLQHLDLENSKNITESILKSFIQKFPELLTINLNNCSGVSDSSISQISYYCQELNTIDISNSRSRVTDVSIYALAKFGKQKLRNLNFSSMQKISDAGINALANHCKHLEMVNLSNCSQLIGSGALENLLMANKNSLKELRMHNMKGVPFLTHNLLELIMIRCEKLEMLSISFDTIIYSPLSEPQDASLLLFYFSQFKSLKKLIFYDVPEHASTRLLWNLIECCGTECNSSTSNMITNDSADRKSALKEVMIYRAKYESDFILGGYTKTSMKNFEKDDEEVSEGWVRKFNVQHPSGPKIKLTLLDE